MMKLRLGQPVNSTDGPFGALGDIVIEPFGRRVTHLVVEPNRNHYQARLVPIWLAAEADGELTIQLDESHLRQLETVAFTDFVPLDEVIEVGEGWDVGTEDVVSMPYVPGVDIGGMPFDQGWTDDRVGIRYDRIPKGECEIRRQSEVVTSDDHSAGHVEGLLADDDHITAVVVRAGLPGFRHDVLIPLGSVARVRSDRIELSIDHDQFHLLPKTEVLGEPDELPAHIDDLKVRAEAMAARISTYGRDFVSRTKRRIHDGTADKSPK